jgi:hypothetical protein
MGNMSPRFRFLAVFLFLVACLTALMACRTEPPSALSAAENTIYEDSFDLETTGTWLLEGDEQGQASISNGQLLLSVDAPLTVQYVTLSEPLFDDLVLEVDATQVAGNANNSYGVLVRKAGAAQFYRFEVTGNGQFAVERHDGPDSWVRLTDDWEETPALNAGTGATNHLKIVARGNSFAFYANDQLLAEFSDEGYARGVIAFDAGTFGQTSVQVAFDNLLIGEP